MQIRAPIILQSTIKALVEVVIPAIATDNRMAQEQAQLIVGLLTLLKQRQPDEWRYDLDELQRLTALGSNLQQLAPAAELLSQLQCGRRVLARAGATPGDLIAAVGALRAAIGEHVSRLDNLDEGSGAAAARLVLQAAREQQLRERAWLLMQGWEIDPASLPSLDALIPGLTATATNPP
jgi:hypothetical protein